MIDEQILDEVLPVPTLEELVADKTAELRDEGFTITNFTSGGVFYTLLVICCKIRIELGGLCRTVLNNLFLSHAKDGWLDLKLADYSKKRKQAQKTRGYVVLSREGSGSDAIRLPKGHILKTIKDITGDELRYFVLEDTILKQGQESVSVLVEAEKEGTRYNVPPGQITRSLTHIEGGGTVVNTEGWIIQEGADTEDDESARNRGLRAWSELATRPIAEKYQNIAEGVPGVLFANVNDQHPRGQGTVDIIITSTAGEATPGLLDAVREAASKIAGPYDDIVVKSSVIVSQPVAVTVTVNGDIDVEGIQDKVETTIMALLQIRKGRELCELLHADVIYAVKSAVPNARNIRVNLPENDVLLEPDKVIVAGDINVTIVRA